MKKALFEMADVYKLRMHEMPTMEEILEMIPAENRFVVQI